MGKVNAWDVVKYVVQGIAEDISHKKMASGVGKWNDLIEVKKKKDEKKKSTPDRFSFSPKRAGDIKKRVSDTKKALYQ